MINAFVVKGELKDYDSSVFQKVSVDDFINELPGYSAQNLTFGLMIGFLIVISAIIIGIFMYVLTIQKTPYFGIMKAQGIFEWNYWNFCFIANILTFISWKYTRFGWNVDNITCITISSTIFREWTLLQYNLVSLIIFSLVGTLFSV